MENRKQEEKETVFLGLITFAMTIAHYDQKRKNDDKMPYAIHPMMVAFNPATLLNKVLTSGERLIARTAALLHDVVEDCDEENLRRSWDYLQQHAGSHGLYGSKLDERVTWDKRSMLARIIDYCWVVSGLPSRKVFDEGPTFGFRTVGVIEELTVPKGAHPDGHYEEGDKPARKAWERSLQRMASMSKIALCVTFNDKLYNMRSPMPGRDPTAALMGYGEYLDNIVYALSTEYGIAVQGVLPNDAEEAILMHRTRNS